MKKTMKSVKSGNQSGVSKKPSNLKKSAPKRNNAIRTKARRDTSLVGAASAYSSQQLGKSPQIIQGKDSVRVIHRELVANISGGSTSAFAIVESLACNPGISATFQWLSVMAQNWETYRFNKLKFEYYTRTGTSTPGSVIMAPDYDAADSQPPSEQIMSTYEDAVEDAPWKDICCNLRPASMHNTGPRKYVRTGPLAANLDIKMYDVANLFAATVDSSAAASWGKLWVEYDCTLFSPQSLTSIPVGVPGGSFDGTAGTGSTLAKPLGTAPVVNPNNYGIVYNPATGSFIFSKTGDYVIAGQLTGTTVVGWSSALTNATNIGSTFATDGTSLNFIQTISVTGANATWTPALTAATSTGGYVDIGSAPSSSLL